MSVEKFARCTRGAPRFLLEDWRACWRPHQSHAQVGRRVHQTDKVRSSLSYYRWAYKLCWLIFDLAHNVRLATGSSRPIADIDDGMESSFICPNEQTLVRPN